MAWVDYINAQRLFVDGVEQSPRTGAWNFIGVSVTYNPSTRMHDITVLGGSGAGHTIQEEGSSLPTRAILNFVGPNVTVTDTGGKTTVSIPSISLSGSGVSGILPVDRGGTGLTALGAPLQVFRVNAAGDALEFGTVSGGAVDIAPVNLATTANITLSGEQTIDGTLTSASRVLVWKQTTASQNGIYVTGAGAWTRATDQDATAEFRPGVPFLIKGGTAHAGKLAVLLTGTTITVGSSSIAYGLSFAAPVDVTDDNKVAIASGGGLTYALLVDANVSGSAAIAGTKISPNFGAQDITTTGVINHGSSPALSGDFRVYRGWTMKGRTPSNGGLDINLLRWNTSDQFLIGDSGGVGSVLGGTILFSGDDITLLRTGNVKLKMAANLQVYASTMEWEGSVTTPTFRIAPSSAASTAPNDWNCYGQDMSGAGSSAGAVRWRAGNASGASGTRNGGDFDVQPGAGPTADGELALRAANGAGLGTKRIRINSTGLGFFNTAPVAQPNVTGSRGGNAALASALTALANLGLITDGSSA